MSSTRPIATLSYTIYKRLLTVALDNTSATVNPMSEPSHTQNNHQTTQTRPSEAAFSHL